MFINTGRISHEIKKAFNSELNLKVTISREYFSCLFAMITINIQKGAILIEGRNFHNKMVQVYSLLIKRSLKY